MIFSFHCYSPRCAPPKYIYSTKITYPVTFHPSIVAGPRNPGGLHSEFWAP